MNRFLNLAGARTSSRPAGMMRIGIGLAAMLMTFEMAPTILRFSEPGIIRVPYLKGAPSVVDLPGIALLAGWFVSAGLFAIGAFATVAGIVLTATISAAFFSDQQLYSNHFYLLVLLIGLLTLARPGAALSVDALRKRGGDQVAEWPLFLIRAQISIVYLFTGLAKLNPHFLSGMVVAESLRKGGPLAIPVEWRTTEPMIVMSLGAIAAELFLSVALWIPRLRPIAFVIGLGLHAFIALWLSPSGPLMIFSLIILSPYILFLDAPRRDAVLVWDASCGFCRQWVGMFRRLDWLHALRIIPSGDRDKIEALGITPQEADRALQLIRGGRRATGFRALIGVLELTPLAFLWAPVLRLAPIAWVGERAYRRVAARRLCSISQIALGDPGRERS